MELASSANKMGLTKILTRSNGGNAFSASIPFRVPATATSDAASSNADITGTALMTVTIPETTAAADKLRQRLRGTPFFDKSQELQSELYARTQDELDALGSEVKVHLPSFSSAAFVLLSDDAHKASAARSLLVGTDLSNCRYGTERWNKRALKQTMGAADRQSLSDSYGKPVSSKTMQEPVILEADDDLQSMAWNSTKETLQPEMSMQAGGLLLATDEHRIGDLYCRPLYASDDGNATQVPLDAYARLTKVYLPQSREDRVAMDAALRRPSDCSFPDLQAHHDERLKGTAATSRGSSKVFRGPVRWEKPGVKVTTLGPAVSVSTHPGDLRFTRISEDGSFQKLFSCVRPVELVSAEKQQDGSALEVKTRGMAHYDVGVKGEVTTIE